VLVFPETKVGHSDTWNSRESMDSHLKRCAAGPWDDVEPLEHQCNAAVLSEPQSSVAGWEGISGAKIAVPVTRAASSKSLLVMVPGLLVHDTRRLAMCDGKRTRKAKGWRRCPTEVGSQ
jgi:hypothetical protein